MKFISQRVNFAHLGWNHFSKSWKRSVHVVCNVAAFDWSVESVNFAIQIFFYTRFSIMKSFIFKLLIVVALVSGRYLVFHITH